jgi:hypothetical protein|tara:strand:+ start:608 stop:820 length:213 start_codon:yes stop_codon:yes gene_type:complete
MDVPDYLIINPLRIELTLMNTKKINNEIELTEIEKRFYNKIEKLKNISLQNKRLKYMIRHINHRLILTDV